MTDFPMTTDELIAKLQKLPKGTPVYLRTGGDDAYPAELFVFNELGTNPTVAYFGIDKNL